MSNVVSADKIAQLRKKTLTNMQKGLEEFSNHTNHVLSKLKFLDIRQYPSDPKYLSEYCVDDIKFLLEYFTVPLQNAGMGSSIDVMRF